MLKNLGLYFKRKDGDCKLRFISHGEQKSIARVVFRELFADITFNDREEYWYCFKRISSTSPFPSHPLWRIL